MASAETLGDDFKKIFNATQFSTGSHHKSAVKLINLYNQVEPGIFNKEFKKYIAVIVFVDPKLKCPYTERTMEFIALTCYHFKQQFEESTNNEQTEEDPTEHPFIENLMSYLLELQQKVKFSVRFRSCQLINKILDKLVETELSVDFCDRIENALLERLNDPKLEVQLEGILALHRFQDKLNPKDKIIDLFKTLMEQDRFAKVRKLCVQKISLRRDVVPIILSKIRDVDVGVRLAAYERLINIPKGLKIEQRRVLLNCGHLDTDKKIQTYMESTLLPAWLSSYDNSFYKLMEAIRFDADEKDIAETNKLCEFVLRPLFKSKPLEELLNDVEANLINKVIPYDKLDWETCNFWRILVQFIREHENHDEEISRILPELIPFCKYIRGFCNSLPKIETTTDFLKNQFIIKQLFTISKGYDLSDPVCRSTLNNLIGNVLKSVVLTLDTVKVIVGNLECIVPNIEVRARYINQLISDIQTPENIDDTMLKKTECEEKIRAIKADILETTRNQEVAIAEKDYKLAGSLEEKLKQFSDIIDDLVKEKSSYELDNVPKKKQDVATIVKYLNIALGFLLSAKVTEMTSSLETLKNETIFELMIHENQTVQAKALHCYAVFSVIDRKVATDGIHIFSAPISGYQSGQECDIQILLTCIGAISDILRVYGTQLIAAPDDDAVDLSESQMENHKKNYFGGTSLTNLIQGLVDLMDDEQIEVQETAGRGLCSLVIDNTIQSSSLLSRLVLKWCNPSDESQKLKQMIGVTLQQLPNNPDFHKQWEDAIMITLKAIIYAPADTPLDQVNPDDIAKFMLALYQINLENDEVLLNFAMKVCSEIKKKPRAKQVHTFTKLLNMLNISNDHPMVDDILAMCDELRDVINNHNAKKNLIKFISKLNLRKPASKGVPSQSQNDSDDNEDDEDELQQQENQNQSSSDDTEED